MPIVGAVVHLDPLAQAETLAYLHNHSAVTLGDPQPGGWPVVLDCASKEAEEALWDELQSLPGILHITVVFADFSDIVFEGVP